MEVERFVGLLIAMEMVFSSGMNEKQSDAGSDAESEQDSDEDLAELDLEGQSAVVY